MLVDDVLAISWILITGSSVFESFDEFSLFSVTCFVDLSSQNRIFFVGILMELFSELKNMQSLREIAATM